MNRRQFCSGSVGAAVAAALPVAYSHALFADVLTDAGAAIAARAGDGRAVELETAAVRELGEALRGNLLLRGNDGYDSARRVLNASIDRYPALIVQPSGVADIRHAVDFARERALLLAVKCGGHSFSGQSTCDGGMQLDLSTFRHVRVDPQARIAHVAGGSLLGEVDHEAMASGLVTTTGTVSHTGVSGLTLGGGFGRLARRFGLALDNVLAVDIVTADGQLRHASAGENPDLYWGVRGGGGNFGVVTGFQFALHPMQRQVIGGEVVFPIARAKELLRFYADFSMNAPDELYADFAMMAPPGGGDAIALIHVCCSGDAASADTLLAPLRKLGTPLADGIKAQDYVAIQRSWDNSDPRNEGEYLKSGFISGFPDALLEAIADGFEADPARGTTFFFQHSGGAIGRIAEDATAFAHRDAQSNMFIAVTWPLEGDPAPTIGYLRDYWSTLEPFTSGYYTNETADESHAVRHANYRGNFARLERLKKRYDPGNLFRLNANILPSA